MKRFCFFVCDALEPRRMLAAGALDPSFGDAGQVTVDFGPSTIAECEATVVQSDDGPGGATEGAG